MEKHLGELPQVRGRRVTKIGSGAKALRGAGVDFQGRSALRQDPFKVFKSSISLAVHVWPPDLGAGVGVRPLNSGLRVRMWQRWEQEPLGLCPS